MNNVLFLLLRRMRLPLVLIIVVYTICVGVLAVVPGADAAGNPTPGMGLFHAFYVISYTGTSIGFGELPVPFSTGQRLWMTACIYLAVGSWTYTAITVIGLVGEPAFQSAVRAGRFARKIRRLREPFYIVCGGGETGTLVCHGLDRLGLRFVLIEADGERLQQLRLEDFHTDAPMLSADASQPATLTDAGLLSAHCRGVMALTVDDATNRSIAVAVRLLTPGLPVLARVGDPTLDLHVGAFGGDMVVNPFERFAQHLASAVATPERYRLGEIVTGLTGDELPDDYRPPRGHWIMCGYGRFGHRIREELSAAGLTVTVIDRLHFGEAGVDIQGSGTDAGSLRSAGVGTAAGIVAGNASDLKNLAIAITARDLNPDIFVVTRQNQLSNRPLFAAFHDDLCMQPSRIVAREFLARITTPLLTRFMDEIPRHDERWCAELSAALTLVNAGRIPELWSTQLTPTRAGAAVESILRGKWVTVGHLLADPFDRTLPEQALVLMVARGDEVTLLPGTAFTLEPGDDVLLAGSPDARRRITLTLQNANVLNYVRTGREGNGGWLWQWLHRRRRDARQRDPAGTHRDR